MFAEVKDMLPVSGDGYDAQIINEINACALDLERTANIVLPGVISISRTHQAATTSEPEGWIITDNSTVADALVIRTIATWCNMNLFNPPNYENLRAAYDSLKGRMQLSSYYNR